MWSISASLMAGVIVLVAGEDLGFLADNDFFSELVSEGGLAFAFRFFLGGVNGSDESFGDGEADSDLTGIVI